MINVYSIRDVKAGKYNGLICFPNDEMAKRAISSAVNYGSQGTLLHEYPEDVQVFKVGSFDEDTGAINSLSEFICNAVDLRITKKEENV